MNRTQTLKPYRTVNTLTHVVALALLWPLALVSAVAARLDSKSNRGEMTRLGRFMRKAQLDRFAERFLA